MGDDTSIRRSNSPSFYENELSPDEVPEKSMEDDSIETGRTETITSEERANSTRKFIISLIVVVCVAVAWVSSTQFSKSALLINPNFFYAPYFMLWLNTCWMITCFPIFCVYNLIRGSNPKQSFRSSKTVYGGSVFSGIFRVALFLVLWTGANYTYLRALGQVSASVATSISSCNTAIVYILALFLLGDKLVIPKVLSVFLAIGGVVLISLDGQISAMWVGVLLAVVSAFFSASYKVLFKRILGNATLGEVSLFMSSLGLLNAVVNAIPAFLLIAFGVEKANWSYVPWGPLLASGSLNLLFNFLINFGIALLHPLVISVGMLVGLPLNTVFDILFRGVHATAFFISGTVLVVISFVLVIFPYTLVPFCRRFVRQ